MGSSSTAPAPGSVTSESIQEGAVRVTVAEIAYSTGWSGEISSTRDAIVALSGSVGVFAAEAWSGNVRVLIRTVGSGAAGTLRAHAYAAGQASTLATEKHSALGLSTPVLRGEEFKVEVTAGSTGITPGVTINKAVAMLLP